MMPRINSRLLNQNFDYYEFEAEDAWAKATYKEPITVNHIRIDEHEQSAGNYISVAFVYKSHTTPFLNFKRRSKIVAQNKTYIINDVVKINEPLTDQLWSVELELI